MVPPTASNSITCCPALRALFPMNAQRRAAALALPLFFFVREKSFKPFFFDPGQVPDRAEGIFRRITFFEVFHRFAGEFWAFEAVGKFGFSVLVAVSFFTKETAWLLFFVRSEAASAVVFIAKVGQADAAVDAAGRNQVF